MTRARADRAPVCIGERQFVINSGSGTDNIGNMTPSRAMTFVKTINGTLKLSKRATLAELDKLFKESHTCHIVTALPVPLEVTGSLMTRRWCTLARCGTIASSVERASRSRAFG
mmetsp:Transcript_21326/g.53050  ORF Transcript_21326/g.53050 Transcript_21326/m.53050 type:complete len:114 (-) Transcript_21326:129-470(-)